jgi:DNA segregation ATPase FtsK/SpoIIIE, S-DNA-T family
MAKPRQNRAKESDSFDLAAVWKELQENLTQEALGLFVFVIGGYLGFSLLVSGDASWVARMTGWTAGWVVLGLLLLGGVLMIGERAGYWNPEAVVGAELLLLSLQSGVFVLNNERANWLPPALGDASGWLGWGLGNILVSGLGQWPAAFTILIFLGVGVYLLCCHTPLIYLFQYVNQFVNENVNIPFHRLRRNGEPAYADFVDEPEPRRRAKPKSPAHSDPAAILPEDPAPPVASVSPDPAPALSPDPAEKAAPTEKRKAARSKASQAAPAKLQVARSVERLPAIEFLDADSGRFGSNDTRRVEEMIQQTLADFDIPVRVVNVESGPTVTQYGIEPLYIERGGQRRKVRVSRIVNLADDLALALAAPSVRIEAPVPGHPYVGIEVPNVDKSLVAMRGILESSQMAKSGGFLPVALGRDTAGLPVVTDLSRAPHLLIAGSTGSGKSVCINSIIISLLMHHGPESLRFVMIDPKMVELPGYNGIPHLIGKVITEMDHVVGALTWLLLQMDDRYQKFRAAGVRNIAGFNEKAQKSKDLEPLPFIVLVVDELADLMMTAPEDVEKQLVRLAQMARATGIHMVLATQRPSTDVVTGLIKANFPTRIAFAVTSQIDSRVVLDSNGAEKLLGQGDMLFMSPSTAKLLRVQGCWVSDKEIERIVKFWQAQAQLENPGGPESKVAPWIGLMDQMDDEDELLQDVMDVIRGMETCTTSYVQRKLRIGYPKAARLMEQLEAKGLVGPDMGGGQGRQVRMRKQEEGEEDEEEL